jgi:ATP-binding cassette subfamily C protein
VKQSQTDVKTDVEPYWRRLLNFGRYIIAQTRWRSVTALVFLLLGSLTEGVSVVLLIPILEIARPGNRIWLRGYVPELHGEQGLAVLLIAFVTAIVLRGVLMRQTGLAMTAITLDLTNRIRVGLFASIAFAKWGFVATLRAADLDHALSTEVNRVQLVINQIFISSQSALLLLIYTAISLFVSPLMTLFAAMFGLLLFLLMRPVRRATAVFGELFTIQHQKQHQVLSAFIGSVKTAKSFNAEPAYIKRFSAELEAARQAQMRYTEVSATGGIVSQVVTAVGMAGFSYMALIVYHLAFTNLAVLLFAFMRMAPRISALQNSSHQIMLNLPAYETMRRLQARCDDAREPQVDGTRPLALHKQLRFEAVRFTHAGQDIPSIFEVSFVIPARQITAFIGPSGSGKSTLADLVLGLIEPQAGRIMIDDVELDGTNRRNWRTNIAYVPQEVILTHDTILENLRIAFVDASETEIWHALEAANAASFVRALPEQLLTIVGERGLRLSGGERQRIALARALLRLPQLLILDEGTSALDWESQALVAQSIERLRGQITVVTIAHRPSMIAIADWVVALEKGRVVETGAYKDMIAMPESRLRYILTAEAII